MAVLSAFFTWNCAQTGWPEYRDAMACDLEGRNECARHYSAAIRKNPQLPGVHASYGSHLIRQGDLEKGQAELEKEYQTYPAARIAVSTFLDRRLDSAAAPLPAALPPAPATGTREAQP